MEARSAVGVTAAGMCSVRDELFEGSFAWLRSLGTSVQHQMCGSQRRPGMFVLSSRCVMIRGRPNFVFFIFRRQKTHFFRRFYFSAEKDIRIFVSFLIFGTKMAVKKTKKESQYFG